MKPQPMHDVFAEYEAELVAKAKAEMARDTAAWNALPQSERDRINAERDARMAVYPETTDDDADEEDEEEDDDQ